MTQRTIREQLLDQLDFYWDTSLWPRVQGLTDDEYFWQPVADCWTIREGADGEFTIDWAYPAPEPPPFTTIAWRLAHIAIPVLGMRASNHFGDGSVNLESVKWPGDAETALAVLHGHYQAWRNGVRDADLDKPVGEAEGAWAEYPYSDLVLHINREVMHHGGEIALLRDLYRATGGAPI